MQRFRLEWTIATTPANIGSVLMLLEKGGTGSDSNDLNTGEG